MALVAHFDCTVCHQPKHEVVVHTGLPLTCAICRADQADKDRRMHFAGLKGLTVEERLELLESHFYELKAERRLKSLEAKTATY